MPATNTGSPTTSHWGAFHVGADADGGLTVLPHPADPAPSPLLGNVAGALRHRTRVERPAVRRGWLEDGPGPAPGAAASRSSRCPGTRRWTWLAAEHRQGPYRARRPGRLRRLLRLVQRGPLPPRAEPGARFLDTGSAATCARSTPTASGLAGDPAACRRRRGRGLRAGRRRGDDRRAHRADRRLRRHAAEERRSSRPAASTRHVEPGALDAAGRARRPLRPGQPAARRPARGRGRRMAARSPRPPTSR